MLKLGSSAFFNGASTQHGQPQTNMPTGEGAAVVEAFDDGLDALAWMLDGNVGQMPKGFLDRLNKATRGSTH